MKCAVGREKYAEGREYISMYVCTNLMMQKYKKFENKNKNKNKNKVKY